MLLLGLLPASMSAQISISATGADPDSSAMLDIQSTNKGLLTPRMTEVQRDAISGPATGLLIYQTDGKTGFYYNEGTPASPAWVRIGTEEPVKDARTPIDSVAHFDTYGSVGYANYVITEPGTYYLTQNVSISQTGAFGIVIAADHVFLDLNGFALIGDRVRTGNNRSYPPNPGGSGDAIHLDGARSFIHIKNGSIENWQGNGISGTQTEASIFQSIHVSEAGRYGIELGDQNLMMECVVRRTYLGGFSTGIYSTLLYCKGFITGGDGFDIGSYSKLEQCMANGNANEGIDVSQDCSVVLCHSTENEGRGIRAGLDCLINQSVASDNEQSGIEVSSDCIVANSACFHNGDFIISTLTDSTIYSGIRIVGNGGFIYNNQCIGNHFAGISGIASTSTQDTKVQSNWVMDNEYVGILMVKSGGLVIQNYVSGTANGPGYRFRSTTNHGPIIQVKGAGVLSTVTHADHPFANYNN